MILKPPLRSNVTFTFRLRRSFSILNRLDAYTTLIIPCRKCRFAHTSWEPCETNTVFLLRSHMSDIDSCEIPPPSGRIVLFGRVPGLKPWAGIWPPRCSRCRKRLCIGHEGAGRDEAKLRKLG